MPFTKETAALYGKKGGRNNVKKNGRAHMSRVGALGGQVMLKRGGKEYYSRIGSISGYTRKKPGEGDQLVLPKEKYDKTS